MTYPPRYPLYFGCIRSAGHYVLEGSQHAGNRHAEHCEWLSYLDGKLPPEGSDREGVARLHHFNGCTLLAFWDRSVDTRPGSNSVFLLPNPRLSFERAVAAAKVAYPHIWQRFKFEVVQEALA